jgi:hypothetical protein
MAPWRRSSEWSPRSTQARVVVSSRGALLGVRQSSSMARATKRSCAMARDTSKRRSRRHRCFAELPFGGHDYLDPRATPMHCLRGSPGNEPPPANCGTAEAAHTQLAGSGGPAGSASVNRGLDRYLRPSRRSAWRPFGPGRAAHTNASDVPVLPPVYSTARPPRFRRPEDAVPSMTDRAILSFRLPVVMALELDEHAGASSRDNTS